MKELRSEISNLKGQLKAKLSEKNEVAAELMDAEFQLQKERATSSQSEEHNSQELEKLRSLNRHLETERNRLEKEVQDMEFYKNTAAEAQEAKPRLKFMQQGAHFSVVGKSRIYYSFFH
jgi:chromosome segregation ATPase